MTSSTGSSNPGSGIQNQPPDDPLLDDSSNALLQLLRLHELEQFYIKLRDDLQITRPSHLTYASPPDLTSIGLSSPAALRLIQGAKKERNRIKRKKLTKLLTGGGATGSGHGQHSKSSSSLPLSDSKYGNSADNALTSNLITCLIQEKDLLIPQNAPPLGTGSFGIVLRGTWNCPTAGGLLRNQLPVAVKLLKQDALKSPSILTEFITEVQAMAELRHPNLIRLYGIVLGNPLMMVTELAELGNLLDYIRKEQISIIEIFPWALQITSAMHYLESNRRLHRDLACRNIFMTSLTHVKLGDFGLLRSIPQEQDYYLMTERSKVPFPWCAPESLKYRRWEVGSDAWSWAVTLWELFTFGEEPWIGLNGAEIFAKIETGERMKKPEACSTELWKVVLECWAPAPSSRPRFKSLLNTLTSTYPQMLLATQDYSADNKLSLLSGDKIAIIDGKPENFYWKGQNLRTFQIGYFPRSLTSPLRPRSSNDISAPLRNSFIHTGHGSGGAGENSWGSPSFIDEVYLKNPMEPEDMYAAVNVITRETNSSSSTPTHQFKYTKLKSSNSFEKQIQNQKQTLSSKSKSSAPHRPPPPKNLSDVGVLIDFEGDQEENLQIVPPGLQPEQLYYNLQQNQNQRADQFYANSNSSIQQKEQHNLFEQHHQQSLYANVQDNSRQELSSINYPMDQLQEYQYKSAPSSFSTGSTDKYSTGSFSSFYDDPFDTSKVFTSSPPVPNNMDQHDSHQSMSGGSRYYSTVPMMPPSGSEAPVNLEPKPTSFNTPPVTLEPKPTPSPSYTLPAPAIAIQASPSPNFLTLQPQTFIPNTTSINSTPSPPIPKPSLELIKKRNEAFEWLDMALGGLNVSETKNVNAKARNASGGGSTLGVSVSEQKTNSASTLNQFENNFSEQFRLPPIQPSQQQKLKLDSGDEIWMQGLPNSNSTKPNTSSNSGTIIPAIPPPPPPGTIIRNNFSTMPKSPGKITNMSKSSNNIVVLTENERKIRELESLGLGFPRSRLESVLIQAAWNIEVAAGRLLDESF